MRVEITSKPHGEMRYDTAGDWVWENGVLKITVTRDTPSEDHQFLIALHELVEAYLCKKRGISQESVDRFDMNWEGIGDEEPGDDREAPYRNEHRFAMLIEHLMAHELGMKMYGTVR